MRAVGRDHRRRHPRADGIIAPAQLGVTRHNPAQPAVDLGEVAAVIAALGAAGVQVQKRVAREVNALLYARLRPAVKQGALRIKQEKTHG